MIRLLTNMASATRTYDIGEVVSLDADVEARLIASGQAEPIKPEVKRPKASTAPRIKKVM